MSERKEDWYLTIAETVVKSAVKKLASNKDLSKTLRLSKSNPDRNGYHLVREALKPFDSGEKFPTIFYKQLNNVEVGNDLQNTDINGVRCTVEVHVYDNTEKGVEFVQLILTEIIKEFKLYGFTVNQFPQYSSQGTNVTVGIIRCTRVVGADDKDLTFTE